MPVERKFLLGIFSRKYFKLYLIVISIILSSHHFFAQIPIGYWREHLPYQNAIQVVKGDKMYCATKYAVYSIDDEGELQRYSKITGLNDIGVNCIEYNNTTQQLIIAYNNSNVDIIKGDIVKNLGDIKRSNITGNKTINSIFCKSDKAYLCTGLGIVVADLSKHEIKDTWIIGTNGNQTTVNAITSDDNFFYSATNEGVKRANINASNLSNYTAWQNISGNGLSAGLVQNILWCNNKVVAQKNDSLFILNGNNWSLLYAEANWKILSTSVAENKIFITQNSTIAVSRVLQLNVNGVVEKNLSKPNIISLPKYATSVNGVIWIADFYGSLSKYENNNFQQYTPNGTLGSVDGKMIFDNDMLYAAAGSVNEAWNYLYNRDGIFTFKDGSWSYDGYYTKPVYDSVLDFIALAVDRRNKSLWAGSYGGGLVNINNSTVKIYKQNNSTLQAAIGDASSYRISGLVFDANNNLWISNYAAPQGLHVLKANGTFKAITIPFSYFENAVSEIIVDDENQIWIVSPRGNGVFCYNYGTNIDAINDDKWKFFKTGINNGNLPSNNVYCITKDKNGFVWIGTDKGIAVVQCTNNVFTTTCDAVLPIVQQGAFAGYLFKDEEVHCIAVDGANRKWVGTKNGLWLISADGDKVIYQFTENNSPLLSNDVKQLAINPNTGEVFIATFKGVCSFRSTATEATETMENILVFPNPVPPNYQGSIAIKGLVNNTNIKIAEVNGRLVFETRSLGGQAVWNGKNYKGEKVANGVYLVFARNDDGTERLVTKIFMANAK